MKKIMNDADYDSVMHKIDILMAKGSGNVTHEELAEIRQLAEDAQAYERSKFTIKAPVTLTGMIEMRMFELRLKKKELANKLKISEAKLSLIMNGKQRPDVGFLKAIHNELNIDADFILEHV